MCASGGWSTLCFPLLDLGVRLITALGLGGGTWSLRGGNIPLEPATPQNMMHKEGVEVSFVCTWAFSAQVVELD